MRTTTAVLAAAVLLAVPALAHDGEGHEKNEKEHFAAMKAGMLKDLDAQIAALQKFRACADGAADHAAMKKCHEEKEASMKEMWKAKKAERLKQIDDQQQKLDQEKKKLQQDEPKP